MWRIVHPIVVVVAGALLALTLWLVLFATPEEATLGIVQKIFYFHVPAAYSMYLGWAVCAVASVVYLVRRGDRADALARSAAEVALVFAMIVMISGPLWGRKSWGAFWTWDPRLTSSLLLTLIIAGYALLRALGKGEPERRFAAALAILGACVAPIIHVSVTKWRGQHPTVISKAGGGLAPEMVLPFALGMISFTVLFAALLSARYRLELARRRLADLEERAAVAGVATAEDP
jgi:heme exporter protein C